MKIQDVAVYESRKIEDPGNPGGFWIIKKRGWWDLISGAYLGKNRTEAEDSYAILFSYRHCSGHENVTFRET